MNFNERKKYRQWELLGKYLAKVRKAQGRSQPVVAKELGYPHYQFLSNIERGIVGVPREKLRDFLVAYRIDLDSYIKQHIEAVRQDLIFLFLTQERIKQNGKATNDNGNDATREQGKDKGGPS